MSYTSLALFIDGQWIDAEQRETLNVYNPATEQCIGHLPCATQEDIENAIQAAEQSAGLWRNTSALNRAEILRKAASLLRERSESIGRVITLELGKPYGEAVREVITAAEMFEWGAEEARRLYGRIIPSRDMNITQMVTLEPVGPVAAFSGWNAPAITPSRKIAGALAAGCTVVIKPSEETPGVALEIVRAVNDAGLPKGVLNAVFGDPAKISRQLIEAPEIKMVTFTGATSIGQELAVMAAPYLKHLTLELGGHAPVLVFDDVDIAATAKLIASAKFRNSGQICTSPTRMYVHQKIYEKFVDAFTKEAKAIKVGNGLDEGVQMGPMANPRRYEAIKQLIGNAVENGAQIVAGGNGLEGPGWFIEPTVIRDFNNVCEAANTEPFGPLALIRPFNDFDEAIKEANRLPFGLASYVFTNNLTVAKNASKLIQSGVVCVNHCQASLPETPFGGVKNSGLGREGGIEGLQEFLSIKYISQL